jgi:hypothetical protein
MSPADVYWEYRQIMALEYERKNPGKKFEDDVKTDDRYEDYQRSLGIGPN